MKKIRLYFKEKQIQDQYTLDLQDNLTSQDFYSIITLFNEAAHSKLPPGSKMLWILSLFLLWTSAATLLYLLWMQLNNHLVLVVLPVFIITSILIISVLYRSRKLKFEESIQQICSQLNATENIRGINFSFIKDGMNISLHTTRLLDGMSSVYAIDIELDDRYSALRSRQFNRRSPSDDEVHQLTSPKLAYINHYNIDENNYHYSMFQDPPPSWSPPYNEKAVFHLA